MHFFYFLKKYKLKLIKLSLLETLIAGSALDIDLPIVSCSSYSEETVYVVFVLTNEN
ncbi:MAG: hypothetical protein ACRCUM_01815 [Mycoplasmoidaceae bacterium]